MCTCFYALIFVILGLALDLSHILTEEKVRTIEQMKDMV
jgi:hypothetical protein